jgi:iron complex transport system ATP-binding protein
MTDQPTMQLQDLDFAYQADRPVIRGVSVEARPGRLIALIGPNASGKSTLLRIMLGHLAPGHGKVFLRDRPLDRIPAARRAAAVSYVPQRSSASFAYSVAHVVAMGRFALPWDQQAVSNALAACELNDLATEPFMHLSMGQQQRVLLARALAQSGGEGQMMLLDEPLSAMDLLHVHRSMEILRRRAGEGLCVVVVLHDLNLAARYADEVWLMDAGRIAAAGPWDHVMRSEVLEPVYGVRLVEMPRSTDRAKDQASRPVFDTYLSEPADQRVQ